jgi:glyoxylase-like metal-dependent hydrolase (beta-lactamase superfamily II)
MGEIRQMNFGTARSNEEDTLPCAVCNCLVIDDGKKIILIDSGLGVRETDTLSMLAQTLPQLYDIAIDPCLPASRQLPASGYEPKRVTDIVLTHLDLDHAGGLKDFPDAAVHLSAEEFQQKEDLRYLQSQFDHSPHWMPWASHGETWFGLDARSLEISEAYEILLVPLRGHTWGHSGVAVRRRAATEPWILHVGDAYYDHCELEWGCGETECAFHCSAVDRLERLRSLSRIRHLRNCHQGAVTIISSHDPTETIGEGSSSACAVGSFSPQTRPIGSTSRSTTHSTNYSLFSGGQPDGNETWK